MKFVTVTVNIFFTNRFANKKWALFSVEAMVAYTTSGTFYEFLFKNRYVRKRLHPFSRFGIAT